MDTINDAFSFLLGLLSSPEGLTFILIICFGYLIRVMPFLPNRVIPIMAIIFGMASYTYLKETGDVPPKMHNPLVWKLGAGFIISVLTWTFHDKILKRAEGLLPDKLKGFLDSQSGDPEAKPQNTDNKTP